MKKKGNNRSNQSTRSYRQSDYDRRASELAALEREHYRAAIKGGNTQTKTT